MRGPRDAPIESLKTIMEVNMAEYQYKPIHTKSKIQAVIFDWAGTTVDYGCFAPLEVFLSVFGEAGISLTLDEARGPMGMLTLDYIRALTRLDRVSKEWRHRYGRFPDEDDIVKLYKSIKKVLPMAGSTGLSYLLPNRFFLVISEG